MIKLKIVTHNSGEYEATVSEYNAIDMNAQLNNSEINTVLIGDVILSRIDVKIITPINEI